MNSQEIYDAGYAIPVYNISKTQRFWRYRDNVFSTPMDVETKEVSGLQVLEEKHHDMQSKL